MNDTQSIRIWHENLAALNVNERLPISALKPENHIHGGLRIQLSGRLVPYLGYFGPDDVCLGTWLDELSSAAQAFESSTHALYTFDEGEQGQPAYVFERVGQQAYFSITDAEFSGGMADPDWQRIEFSPEELIAEHACFRESFCTMLRAEAPDVADLWIHHHTPKARTA